MKAWRQHGPGGTLSFDDVPMPAPSRDGVVVRVQSAMVLTYMKEVLAGALGYTLPPAPFVPGTNAVGVVEAVGDGVVHLARGDRVLLSPHHVANERVRDPAQILIGLTAMGGRYAPLPDSASALQRQWRDGVFAEYAHWPAACATPLHGLAHLDAERLTALAKLVVPYGGLLRARLMPGETVIINGATGFYGAGAVLVALAMAAGRVVAAGRNRQVLAQVAAAGGRRVVGVPLDGVVARDVQALGAAAGGKADVALDILGRATSTDTTLAALRALRRGGRLVLMGSADVPLPILFGEMLANDWEIVGQFMYPQRAPGELASLVVSGQLDLAALPITSFPLAELPAAIEAAGKVRGLGLTVVSDGATATT